MIPNRERGKAKSEGRMIALSCSKTTISITKRNNVSTSRQFFCLNFLHSFPTEKKFKSHKKLCENKGFCNIIMRSKDTKILEFNQNQKSDKASFVIYAYLECLTEKIDGCKNN